MSDGTPGSLRRAIARAGAAFLALVQTRIELATVEFEEARERAVGRLVLVCTAVVFLAFAVLMASALVVALFWDTHRVAALVGVTLFHTVIGVFALWRLSETSRDAPRPFAATLAELKRDGEWLSNKFDDRTTP